MFDPYLNDTGARQPKRVGVEAGVGVEASGWRPELGQALARRRPPHTSPETRLRLDSVVARPPMAQSIGAAVT